MRQRVLAAMGCLFLSGIALSQASGTALAQPRVSAASTSRPREPERPKEAAPLLGRSLRGRTAIEIARQLADAKRPDDRRRAVARATSSLPDDELLAFLASLAERGSPLENDPRALLDVARGLARFDMNERALRALFQLTTVDVHDSPDVPHPEEYSAWTRRTAAMAFAQSQSPKMEELVSELAGAISSNEESRAMWTEAFSIPRKTPAPSELVEQLPLAFAAANDLRAADTLWAAAQQNATAPVVLALARLGDRRALRLLAAASESPPAEETMLWAEAAVRLRAPKYEERILELLDDERYAREATQLARNLPSERIVQKLGARGAFNANDEDRAAAIATLGTISHVLALRTLLSLALRDESQLDAFRALALHPSPDAMHVLEQFVLTPPKSADPAKLVRLALRAFAARAFLRGETSPPLVASARTLLTSRSAADRSVAAFALVASGASSATSLGASADAVTRRAVAAGLRTRPDARESARAMLGGETDAHARMLLAFAARIDAPPELGPTLTLERSVLEGYAKGLTLAPNDYAARERGMAQPSMARRLAFLQGTCEGPHGIVLAQRMADAYAIEIEPNVRASLVRCLARLAPESLPAGARTALAVASWSERSPRTRSVARSALAHCTTCAATPPRASTATFLSIAPSTGASLPTAVSGVVVSAEGEVVPVLFDEDGMATMLGVSSEGSQLVLSPRYE